jgi:formate dehydrogenase subunit delta
VSGDKHGRTGDADAAHGDAGHTASGHGFPEPGGAQALGHATGGADHLVKMANDIGNFFRAEPVREDAIAGIANHIAKFWTKRMRQKLNAQLQSAGDSALDELPREALRRLPAA